MQKLGLVGGMGPESTIPYYHDIVYGVQKRLGREEFPELTIESVNVFHVLDLCAAEKYDELTEYLLRAVRRLAASGADFAALSANTAHIVFDRLQQESPIPLVSIIEATRDEANRRSMKKIGLMGTKFTMNGAFFMAPFQKAGIEVVTPSAGQQDDIVYHIVTELEHGIVKPETQKLFLAYLQQMVDESQIEAIVLGCTELPLLFHGLKTPVPVLDTVQIHVDAIVNKILSE